MSIQIVFLLVPLIGRLVSVVLRNAYNASAHFQKDLVT